MLALAVQLAHAKQPPILLLSKSCIIILLYFPSLGGSRLTRPSLGLRRGNGKAMSVAAHHIIINILPGALSHCVFLFTLVISKTFNLLRNYFPLFNKAINCDPTPDSKQYLINTNRYFALVWMNFFCLFVVVAFIVRGFLFILISV